MVLAFEQRAREAEKALAALRLYLSQGRNGRLGHASSASNEARSCLAAAVSRRMASVCRVRIFRVDGYANWMLSKSVRAVLRFRVDGLAARRGGTQVRFRALL